MGTFDFLQLLSRCTKKFFDEKIFLIFSPTLLSFLTDLSEWNRDHVRIWLKSVSQMFDLEMPKVQKFPQTGTQLSSLSKYVIRNHKDFRDAKSFQFLGVILKELRVIKIPHQCCTAI